MKRYKKKNRTSHSNNSSIIKFHYTYTVYFFLVIYLLHLHKYFYEKNIHCYTQHNSEKSARADYLNFCLSYSYIENINNNTGSYERTYLLFYRWLPWSMLFMSAYFYLPKYFIKYSSCENTNNILSFIDSLNSENIDNANTSKKRHKKELSNNEYFNDQGENNVKIHVSEKIANYLALQRKVKTNIYLNFLMSHVFCMCLGLFSFWLLDFFTQGRFLFYLPLAFPFSRNIFTRSDFMSRTFPPFVKCQIEYDRTFISGRTENLLCHLTLMEYYEKIFCIIWIWLFLTTFITIIYVLFIISLSFSCVRYLLVKKTLRLKRNNYSIGIRDFFLLFKIKSIVDIRLYAEIIDTIVIKINQSKENNS